MKKSKFNCHEDNSYKQTDCLNEYYASKLNCNLPWVTSNLSQNREQCQGKEKFTEFKNLSKAIGNPKVVEELQKRGCLIPNCKQRSWNIDSFQKEKELFGDKFLLTILFPHSSKVLVRNEINLYTVSSFFADVGGYMGLLLGESLVSYFLLIIIVLKKKFWSRKTQTAQ